MTTIDLAPEHKVGLTLTNPVMPAAGCYGLGAEYAQLVEVETLGAVVVGPVTAAARRGTDPPRTVPVVGGVLLHTGLANRGIGAIVHRAARVAVTDLMLGEGSVRESFLDRLTYITILGNYEIQNP